MLENDKVDEDTEFNIQQTSCTRALDLSHSQVHEQRHTKNGNFCIIVLTRNIIVVFYSSDTNRTQSEVLGVTLPCVTVMQRHVLHQHSPGKTQFQQDRHRDRTKRRNKSQ